MPDAADRQPRMTLAQFLDWDDGTDARYELIQGRPVAMAPGLIGHGRLVGRAFALLESRLRLPCAPVTEAGIRLRDDDETFLVADVAVSCFRQPANQQWIVDPVLVVEVLSPSTVRHDRGFKLDLYRTLPSVQDIVLVASDKRHVQHWRRDGADWRVADLVGSAVLRITGLGIELPSAELYVDIVD